MSVDKINNPVTPLEVVDKVNEIIDNKQDTLTAGNSIIISHSEDTRSTASIVTVGSNRWQKVAFGSGVYVAVGNDGYITRSTDNGETWETPVRVGTNSWYGVAYGNGVFVAVGNNGYTTYSTNAGETWSTPVRVSGLSSRLQSVAFGNGIFVAVGWDGKSTTSTDGATWTTPVSLDFARGQSIIYDGSKFVVLGDASSTSSVYSTTSSNGEAWTTKVTISSNYGNATGIGCNNGKYLAFFDSGAKYSYSSDYTNWSEPINMSTLVNNGYDFNVQNVYSVDNGFIAVGRRALNNSSSQSHPYKYTTIFAVDDNNWSEPVDIGESATVSSIQYGFLGITYGNNKYVAVGDSGAITYFSLNDGKTYISAQVDDTLSSTSENPVQNKVITSALGDKQDTLVSGTNIKTINNESLLGSGNITISGGGGSATDVQVNGTSITSNGVANIVTNTAYNSSTNKIATMSDVATITFRSWS